MRAKISDLGVAKIVDANTTRISTMTKTPGTQCYMPPEAMVARPHYNVLLRYAGHITEVICVACRKQQSDVFNSGSVRYTNYNYEDRMRYPLTGVIQVAEVELLGHGTVGYKINVFSAYPPTCT